MAKFAPIVENTANGRKSWTLFDIKGWAIDPAFRRVLDNAVWVLPNQWKNNTLKGSSNV